MKFSYRGFDGAGKPSDGQVEAADAREAGDLLRKRGVFSTDITPVGGGEEAELRATDLRPGRSVSRGTDPAESGSVARAGGGRVSRKDVAGFARELSVLFSTGTPLVDALASLEMQSRPGAWRVVLADLRKRVEEGQQLSDAMARHPAVFNGVFRSLIAAGESGGMLDAMLDRLSKLTRQEMKIRGTLTGALVYPCLLIGVCFVVLGAMIGFVMPRFKGLFETLGAPLPPMTKMMMSAGEFAQAWWWAILAVLVIGVTSLIIWLKTEAGREQRDLLLISAPVVRKIARSFATARVARVLGILLDGKVPMLEALQLTKQSAGNARFAAMIANAEDAVTRGDNLSNAFTASGLISPSVCEALRNGERSGRMSTVLVSIADFMDEDNEVAIKTVMGLIEPVILILMGLVVGGVAISLFMPLFDLSAAGGGGGGPGGGG